MRKMRIAFISPFVFRLARGIERFTINLANQLTILDQDVTIITRAPQDNAVRPAIDPAVGVRAIPAARYFEARWSMLFYAVHLASHRYDIVNVFFSSYGEAEALRLVRRCSPIKINFIAGYPMQQAQHQYQDFKQRGLAQLLDRVVVKSRFMVPEIEYFFQRPVEVIPNGIDVEHFDPAIIDSDSLRASLLIQAGESVLLTVAALEERKGILCIIEALPFLIKHGLSVRYIIVGEGPDRAKIEQRIVELDLHSHVHLVGAQSEVRPYYQLADVFLLLSYGEGFPNAFLEALSMGLPVIVSYHPPYDEITQPEFSLQVDESNPIEVADVIETLLGDEKLCQLMGLAAREHVTKNYAWPSVARQYLKLFRTEVSPS